MTMIVVLGGGMQAESQANWNLQNELSWRGRLKDAKTQCVFYWGGSGGVYRKEVFHGLSLIGATGLGLEINGDIGE